MALVINTNVNALLAQQYLVGNQAGLSQAMQRLSSGLRINSAADDPAGLAIGNSMTLASTALQQAERNGNDGISLVQTAQAGMSSITNLLTQMSGLASQASSGTYSSTQLSDINTQFQALLSEVNRVATTAAFNGVNLLDGSTSSVSIQVGNDNTANDRLSITLSNLTTGSTGLNIATLDVTNNSDAQAALGALQTAVNTVSTSFAQLGANQVNLTAAVSYAEAVADSLDTAKSRIVDADFAAESSNLSKFSILNQSNIAMLAQANASPQLALQLLRQ